MADDDDENTFTAAQVEKLTEGLEAATKELTDTRAAMLKRNEEVGKLLKEQETLEKDSKEHTAAMDKIKLDLQKHAEALETLGERYTNFVDTTRKQMKTLGSATEDSPHAFVASNGAIFQCRRQALELGMFFMATMKRDGTVKQNATKWLKERAGDLRHLPQIPVSFVREFGEQFGNAMTEMAKYDAASGGRILQDVTGGATPGSILVRPEFSATLIRNVEQHGKFRKNALIWPMGSDTAYFPRRKGGSGITIYWEGEGDTATEADPEFELLAMTAKKMMGYHAMSSEIHEDAAIDLAAIVMFEFALSVATEEDRIGFNGDGSGGQSPGFAGYVGVLGAAANATPATATSSAVPHLVTGIATNDLTTEITEAKLREMTGRLPTWAERGSKWYMSKSVHADCDGIQMGTAGGSVVKYRDGKTAVIMGDPVVDVAGMPASPSAASTHVLALGNLRQAWAIGDRRDVNMQTSEHYLFKTDQLALRLTARMGFLMRQGNAMVVYKTGTAS